MYNKISFFILITIFLFSQIVFSKGNQEKKDTVKNINDFYLDFPIPDISAFTLLGINTNSITRPGNPKEFVASILNVATTGSKVSPGIAIEWTPYLTFGKKDLSNLKEYRNSKLLRRLQFTFGSNQDSLGSNLAYGFKWTLVDNSDPLLDSVYQDSIIKAMNNYLNKFPLNSSERQDFQEKIFSPLCSTIAGLYSLNTGDVIRNLNKHFNFLDSTDFKIIEIPRYELVRDKCISTLDSLTNEKFQTNYKLIVELDKIIIKYITMFDKADKYVRDVSSNTEFERLKKEYKNKHWNDLSLQIGVGQVFKSYDFSWNKLSSHKFTGFLSTAIPIARFEESGIQLISQLLYDNYCGYDKQNRKYNTSLGGRFLWGNNNFRFSLEGKFSYLKLNESLTDNINRNLRVTAGFEIKFDDGLWFELAFGADGNLNKDWVKPDFITFGNFKYSISKEPRFFK